MKRISRHWFLLFLLLTGFISCYGKKESQADGAAPDKEKQATEAVSVQEDKAKTASREGYMNLDGKGLSIPAQLQPRMVRVEGGVFMMSTNKYVYEELERHEVELDSFMMSETVVPLALWRLFIEDTRYGGYLEYKDWDGNILDNIETEMGPVIYESWYEAVLFCNWLSKKEGLEPAYEIKGELNPETREGITSVEWKRGTNGYRLPTEAEWEYVMYEKGKEADVIRKEFNEAMKDYMEKAYPALTEKELNREQVRLPNVKKQNVDKGYRMESGIISYGVIGFPEFAWDEKSTGEPYRERTNPVGVGGLKDNGEEKVSRRIPGLISNWPIGEKKHNYLQFSMDPTRGDLEMIRLAQDVLD